MLTLHKYHLTLLTALLWFGCGSDDGAATTDAATTKHLDAASDIQLDRPGEPDLGAPDVDLAEVAIADVAIDIGPDLSPDRRPDLEFDSGAAPAPDAAEPDLVSAETSTADVPSLLRPCDNDPSALPVTLQAEALALDGVTAQSSAGVGYVGGFDHPGSSVGFTFCAPALGYYTFTFRYSNGSGNLATRSLVIDDVTVPGKVRFIARANPNRWEPVAASATPRKSVRLTPGRHDVSISYGADDRGVVQLDSIALSAGPQPSNTAVTSILMNNWGSLVAMHFAPKTTPQTTTLTGPRLGGLHWSGDWPTNQVDEATGYLRDDTVSVAYTDYSRTPFESNQALGLDGVVTADYLSFGEAPLPAAVKKEYALVPNENFLLVRYTLENVTATDRAFSFLEHAHPNKKTDSDGDLVAGYRDDLNAWVVNMKASNGSFLIVGALQSPTSYGAASDGGLVKVFSDKGTSNGTSTTTGSNIEIGLTNTVPLAAGAKAQLSFYYAVGPDLASVEAIATHIKTQTVAGWFQAQAAAWATWLASGTAAHTTDPALQATYSHALVTIRQSQQPEFGSFVAATNPAYSFKVWPRDSAAVALGLDGAGYLADAERFWLWMAGAQEDGGKASFPRGTWYTNYDFWQKATPIPFVDPEWDSLGLFLVGTRHHHRLLMAKDPAMASAFLAKVAPAIIDAATFIETGSALSPNHGFGPQDNSIWEDKFQWAGFTQVSYAAGLFAAATMAPMAGMAVPERAGPWLAAARAIKATLVAPYSVTGCNGTWDVAAQYLYRGVNPDCTPDTRVDASVNLLGVLGLLTVDDPKAVGLRNRTIARLAPQRGFNTQGISRFQNDEFYYSSIYSPGGLFESLVPEPVWPQMSMYVAMAEHWSGDNVNALARLHWVVSVLGEGFMAPGEAVDWSTQQMMVSTASEPVTASWFVLGLLAYLDQYDTRLPVDPGAP
jgi:GH15 family glucan-1,4-alpha-glucosidase